MGEILIFDSETDGLLDTMARLHCIQVGTADGDDCTIYTDVVSLSPIPGVAFRPLAEGVERLRRADRYVAHNGIGFDMDAINRFFPGTITREKLIDTLVLARLAQPEEKAHSLDAWGRRTGTLKGKYEGDYQTFDQHFAEYSAQDIAAGRALWHAVKHTLEWGEAAALEHEVAYWIVQQERNGFAFDVAHAAKVEADLRQRLRDLELTLTETFPPLERKATIIPKVNNKTRGYVKGVPFTKRWMEAFNPASRAHIAERLQMLGWKPKEFGANGVPTVDEKTLANLTFPEAKPLTEYFRVLKRLGQLSDGKKAWLKVVKPDGRIYGRVNPNGARTGRMAHFDPNVAQADKDASMRRCWTVRKGRKLVGCDAEGLEARMLGHYLARWDHGEFAKRVVSGDKDARTDVHSVNLKVLVDHRLMPPVAWVDEKGFKLGRDAAKTILYALIYGAGDWKLGETLKEGWRALAEKGLIKGGLRTPSKELGLLVRKALAKAMVGIDKLEAAVKGAVRARGYLIGLDGRHIPNTAEHAALNTLLQSGGAVVMKKALTIFGRKHWDAYHKWHNWAFCANVHDEVQMEVEDDGLGWPEYIGKEFADAIRLAGEAFGLRCPLAGSFDVGTTWADTH